MAIVRRFVNIVAEKSGVYSLHRLDVDKHLFYPSAAQAQANNTTRGVIDRLQELPAPCIRIQAANTKKMAFFGLVNPGSSEGRFIYVNKAGHSLLYDVEADTSTIMPTLSVDEGHLPILGHRPILVSGPALDLQNQDLYVMARAPHEPGCGSCFVVLRLGGTRYEWKALPPPPFVNSHGYHSYDPAIICSHTVVDSGRTICVSFLKGFGTYCFDTVECAWRQVGDWVLPFEDGAEYSPDLNLWLGFSSKRPHHLCWTSELSAMVMDQPPKLQDTWEDVVTPDNWLPATLKLINLGSGRFCIAKHFLVIRDTWESGHYKHDIECEVAVLAGFEIGKGPQGPKVLKHKAISYQFMVGVMHSVL